MSTNINCEVVGHRVLLKPYFDEDVIEEGALKGFKMDVGETFEREKAGTVVGEVVDIGSMAWKAFDGYLANGEPNKDWKPWAKVGDVVYFAKYGGKFIKIDEEDYIIINDEDVQAIYKHSEDK